MRRHMSKKRLCATAHEAVADIDDGATVLVHSFGPPQAWPTDCLLALAERGVKDLTVICNTPAGGPTSLNILADKKQIRRLVCSYLASPAIPTAIAEQVAAGEIELEMVPQGTLVERIRAGGAGLGGFYTPTGVGTTAARGKELRQLGGRMHVFEPALRADFALVQAHHADTAGNLTYRRGMRNFGPAMATAATTTIAEVKEIVARGTIDPEAVVTPGVFVDRIVKTTLELSLPVLRHILMGFGRTVGTEGRALNDGAVGLPPDLMAMKVATLLRDGEYVNLGIGLPTLVSNFIQGRDVTLHAENGILGYGPFPDEGQEDIDLYNASGQFVSMLDGTSFFDSTTSFAMARSGRVTSVVLGAFQVGQNGDLANWSTPAGGTGGIGGAMDLAAGAARVIAICYQRDRGGRSKLVEKIDYPATALACVTSVITDLAWIDIDADGFLLREIAPGLTIDDVRSATAAPLRIAAGVREMQFG